MRLEREVARLETRVRPCGRADRTLAQCGARPGPGADRRHRAGQQAHAACLMASEDMAADLGAERGKDGWSSPMRASASWSNASPRASWQSTVPIPGRDAAGVERDTRWARRLGYKAKSAVAPWHAAIINRVLTPSADEVERAERIVAAFEAAQARARAASKSTVRWSKRRST